MIVLSFDRLSQWLCPAEDSFLTIINGAAFSSVHIYTLSPNVWYFRPFPRPFRRRFIGPQFLGPCEKECRRYSSCREASFGVLASPINRNKLKKRGQTKLPLFTCTRRRLWPRIDDRKRREGAPQFCTTCVGNERAEKRAAEASRKLISPGGEIITRNFVRTRVSWERNLYLPDF